MAALRSFDEPLVLLAGGRDKNLPWEDFASLVRQRVRHLVVFGESADMIAQAVQDRQGSGDKGRRGGAATKGVAGEQWSGDIERCGDKGNSCTITRCKSLREAVQEAARIVQPGEVVLLSPGGTSFDEFVDFEERGEWFKKWVMLL
jgi:UDP-N-acetylmuramoylalanine--D-glutamate ligase